MALTSGKRIGITAPPSEAEIIVRWLAAAKLAAMSNAWILLYGETLMQYMFALDFLDDGARSPLSAPRMQQHHVSNIAYRMAPPHRSSNPAYVSFRFVFVWHDSFLLWRA